MSEYRTEAEAVAAVTRDSHEPIELDLGKVYAFRGSEGHVSIIDARTYGEYPARKSGTVTTYDAASFAAYVNGHFTEDGTSVWCDADGLRIFAVLNGHETGEGATVHAGRGDHRVILELKATDEWKLWTKFSGEMLRQGQFAEHIEDNAVDITDPSSAEMLEIAQSIKVKSKVAFESSQILSSGERQFEYREQLDGKAGPTGKIKIPTEFTVALKPFLGANRYAILARFRYRLTEGNLHLGYALNRADDIKRLAFDDIVTEVSKAIEPTGALVLNGKPA